MKHIWTGNNSEKNFTTLMMHKMKHIDGGTMMCPALAIWALA